MDGLFVFQRPMVELVSWGRWEQRVLTMDRIRTPCPWHVAVFTAEGHSNYPPLPDHLIGMPAVLRFDGAAYAARIMEISAEREFSQVEEYKGYGVSIGELYTRIVMLITEDYGRAPGNAKGHLLVGFNE